MSVRHLTSLRLGWGVLDQGVASLKNLMLGVFVARELGASSLGAMAIVLFVQGLIMNACRGVATDPLMVRFSGVDSRSWRDAVAQAVGTSLIVGACGGALTAVSGLVFLGLFGQSTLGVALLALGVGLPGLMVQDSWRYVFFSAGKGSKSFLNDLVSAALLLGILLVQLLAGASHVGLVVLALGLAGTLSAVFGIYQSRVVPRVRTFTGWLRQHLDLGSRFLGENLVIGLSGQIRALTVAAVAGLAAAGAIRGAEMLVAPAGVVLMGAAQVAVPEAAMARKQGKDQLRRFCIMLSGGLFLFSFLWAVAVVTVFPLGPGRVLLGSVWDGAFVLLPGVLIAVTVGCLNTGPSAGLRALERADQSMRAQFLVSIQAICICVTGGVLWGAQGAVWAGAVAAVVGTTIWWRYLKRALTAESPELAAASLESPGQPPSAPVGAGEPSM